MNVTLVLSTDVCWINLCKFLYIFPKYKKSYSAKTVILLFKVEDIIDKIPLQGLPWWLSG